MLYRIHVFSPARDIELETEDLFSLGDARREAQGYVEYYRDAIAVIYDERGDWVDEFVGVDYDSACAKANRET